MPLVDVQQALTAFGRIRAGHQVATGSGGTRPAALDTWRLSSPFRRPLDAAAEVWGGEVRPFKNDRSRDRWDLITTVTELPIVVLPGDSVSQWYEMWSAAGCIRRCDGRTATLLDGRRGEFPCACDPDPALRECDPQTRISVLLPPLGLGLWRLDTKGGRAASELGAIGALLARATSLGWSVRATLNLVDDEWRGQVENPKTGEVENKVNKFKKPVILTPDLTMDEVASIAAGEAYIPTRAINRPPQTFGAIGAGTAELPAAGRTVDFPAGVGVTAPPPARDPAPPKRRRSTTPADVVVPSTGLTPQTNKAATATSRAEEDAIEKRRADAARGQFHASLPDPFKGPENKRRRHDLYALACGRPEAELEELTGPERNRAMRWAHSVTDGAMELVYDGARVTIRQLDPAVDVASVVRPTPTDEPKDAS